MAPVPTEHPIVHQERRSSAARWLNLLLGAWLFVSAFLWPHTHGSRTNTWAVGLLVIVSALMALSLPGLRFINTILALWLLISAFAVPHVSDVTRWNNVLVGLVVLAVSLVPTGQRGAGYRPPRFVGP